MHGGGISVSPSPGKARPDWPGPAPSEPRFLGWSLPLSRTCVCVCVCVYFRARVCVCGVCVCVCPTLATPGTVARQAPLSTGFFRQEYWSGLPFLSPRDLPDSGIQPRSPALQADSLLTELPGGRLHRLGRHFRTVCLHILGTSLVVQWLRLCPSTAGDLGSISGWGTKIPYALQCAKKKLFFKKLKQK